MPVARSRADPSDESDAHGRRSNCAWATVERCTDELRSLDQAKACTLLRLPPFQRLLRTTNAENHCVRVNQPCINDHNGGRATASTVVANPTLVYQAASKGQAEVVKELLEIGRGAMILTADMCSARGSNALHAVCVYDEEVAKMQGATYDDGRVECVKIILQFASSLDMVEQLKEQPNDEGLTPVDEAQSYASKPRGEEILRLLGVERRRLPVDPDTPPEDIPPWVYHDPRVLYINPPSQLIELVDLTSAGAGAGPSGPLRVNATRVGTVEQVSNTPPAHTALTGFGADLPPGDYVVQPYLTLGESISNSGMRERLALKPIIVTKKPTHGLQWRFAEDSGPQPAFDPDRRYPNYVDLQLQRCRTVFSIRGVARSSQPVTCTLTFKPGYVSDNKVSYKSTLDDRGRFEFVLAPDFVTMCEVTGEGFRKKQSASPPAPQPIDKPTPPVPEDHEDEEAATALPNFKHNKTIWMCDVSASMGTHKEKLRQGLRETIQRYCTPELPNFPQGRLFCIVPWGNNTATASMFPHGQQWLQASDRDMLLEWAGKVETNQGTDMKRAFEAVAASPVAEQARHILVMCDGDANVDEDYLRGLKQRLPQLQHIHFASFKTTDETQAKMRTLAPCTGGNFFALT